MMAAIKNCRRFFQCPFLGASNLRFIFRKEISVLCSYMVKIIKGFIYGRIKIIKAIYIAFLKGGLKVIKVFYILSIAFIAFNFSASALLIK